MLRYHGFLQPLIKIYSAVSVVPGIPFQWNERKGKFVLVKTKIKFWLVTLSLLAILNAFSVKWYQKQKDIVKYSVGLVGLGGLSCVACLLYMLTSSDAVNTCLTFFNGLLQLEKEFDRAGKTQRNLNVFFKIMY